MNYVIHECKNTRQPEFITTGKGMRKKDKVPNPNYCNNAWIDKDLTGATMYPPAWKYCRECCEKLGIDFDSQTPSGNRTPEENERIQKQIERIKKAREDKQTLKDSLE